MYVRYGRDRLDQEITAIFGAEETNPDGSEKVITFGEYIEKVNQRALVDFKEALAARCKASNPNADDD